MGEGSLLGLVRPPVLVFTVVLLYLEFKFSPKLSNWFCYLDWCIMFHNGKMLRFNNHSLYIYIGLFWSIYIFFVLYFGISLSWNNLLLLISFFDLETGPGQGAILSWSGCSNFNYLYLKVRSYWYTDMASCNTWAIFNQNSLPIAARIGIKGSGNGFSSEFHGS